ncbi:MAG TPA: carbonic anhydrase [Streptosporangiaceae bacterium]|nr:carbonic anhydrase [Streptosporangiaceae bacterium]
MTRQRASTGKVNRRGFIRAAGGAGLLAAGLPGTARAGTFATGADGEPGSAPGPAEALRLLMEGNQRFAAGMPEHPRQSVAWRHHLAGGQNPFATVVSCIDSRVPPEIVFDRGLGDMFVVRTGAQALDDLVVLGSIEFGPVNYSSSRLLFVLGHQGCGAVSGAIKSFQTGIPAPGHIQAVVEAIRPAYLAALGQPGNLLDNTIREQTRLTVERLKRDPVLTKLIISENLAIVGGHYELFSGVVTLLA